MKSPEEKILLEINRIIYLLWQECSKLNDTVLLQSSLDILLRTMTGNEGDYKVGTDMLFLDIAKCTFLC